MSKMQILVKVLCGEPKLEIASTILQKVKTALSLQIVTGFATPDGLHQIIEPIRKKPDLLSLMVIGKSTARGCETLDELLDAGVSNSNLKIHLGYGIDSRYAPKGYNSNYVPMVHSKILYMEMPNSMAFAIIGSHNLTGYAIAGYNSEAGVILEGEMQSPEFECIRKHIKSVSEESIEYDKKDRPSLVKWAAKSMVAFNNRMLQSKQDKRTIIILSHADKSVKISKGTAIYVEIGKNLIPNPQGAEVHLFIFDNLPDDRMEAFQSKKNCKLKYSGKVDSIFGKSVEAKTNVCHTIILNEKPVISSFDGNINSISDNDTLRFSVNITDETVSEFIYSFDAPPKIFPFFDDDPISSWKPVRRLLEKKQPQYCYKDIFGIDISGSDCQKEFQFDYVMISNDRSHDKSQFLDNSLDIFNNLI